MTTWCTAGRGAWPAPIPTASEVYGVKGSGGEPGPTRGGAGPPRPPRRAPEWQRGAGQACPSRRRARDGDSLERTLHRFAGADEALRGGSKGLARSVAALDGGRRADRGVGGQRAGRGLVAVIHERKSSPARKSCAGRCNAATVLLAHNHPSGQADPSRADDVLTQAAGNCAASARQFAQQSGSVTAMIFCPAHFAAFPLTLEGFALGTVRRAHVLQRQPRRPAR